MAEAQQRHGNPAKTHLIGHDRQARLRDAGEQAQAACQEHGPVGLAAKGDLQGAVGKAGKDCYKHKAYCHSQSH